MNGPGDDGRGEDDRDEDDDGADSKSSGHNDDNAVPVAQEHGSPHAPIRCGDGRRRPADLMIWTWARIYVENLMRWRPFKRVSRSRRCSFDETRGHGHHTASPRREVHDGSTSQLRVEKLF